MSQEEQDLATHVEICAIRYKGIEEKMDGLDTRLTRLEITVADLKSQMAANFAEIKLLLERQNSTRSAQLIATAGSVIAAILALIGYIITR